MSVGQRDSNFIGSEPIIMDRFSTSERAISCHTLHLSAVDRTLPRVVAAGIQDYFCEAGRHSPASDKHQTPECRNCLLSECIVLQSARGF